MFDPDHSFLYVIKGDHDHCKIGITSDPNGRIAQLRTGSAFPIEFAWIGAPSDFAVSIERDAHQLLNSFRRHGEWFNVKPQAAVGAICTAAHQRGVRMLEVTPEMADQIRATAAADNATGAPQRSVPINVITGLWQWLWRGVILAIVIVAVIEFLGVGKD